MPRRARWCCQVWNSLWRTSFDGAEGAGWERRIYPAATSPSTTRLMTISSLFLLKNHLPILGGSLDVIARFEFAGQDFHGQRIEQVLLDGAFQGPSAKLRVISFLGQEPFGGGVQLYFELLLGKAFLQPLQLDLDDLSQLFLIQAVENDDVVHPIQKLGPEMAAQFH